MTAPLLKWVGGKRQVLDHIVPALPRSIGRYFEPFAGGLAVYLALREINRAVGLNAVLADVNQELVDFYRAVRASPAAVHASYASMFETYKVEPECVYYSIRDDMPLAMSSEAARAARTLFLNKHGFNGVYRVNAAGGFNVPWGKRKAVAIELAEFTTFAKALRSADLSSEDFEAVLEEADENDFAFLDPPYDGTFDSYTATGFDAADQVRLARVCVELDDRGARFMLTNSDTPRVRDLYARFDIRPLFEARAVNADPTNRGKVACLLIRNYKDGV